MFLRIIGGSTPDGFKYQEFKLEISHLDHLIIVFQKEHHKIVGDGVEMFIHNQRLFYSLSPNGGEPYFWAKNGDQLTGNVLEDAKANLTPVTAEKLNSLDYLKQLGLNFAASAESQIQLAQTRLSSYPKDSSDYRDPKVFQRFLDAVTLFILQVTLTKIQESKPQNSRIFKNLLTILTEKIDANAINNAREEWFQTLANISQLESGIPEEVPEVLSHDIIGSSSLASLSSEQDIREELNSFFRKKHSRIPSNFIISRVR